MLDADWIVNAYQSGLSMGQIAKGMGVSKGGVAAVLRRRGVEKRPTGRTKGFHLSDEHKAAISAATKGVPRSAAAVEKARARAATPEGRAHLSKMGKLGGAAGAESRRGAGNGRWKGDEVGYIALHHRVRNARGRAAEHMCAKCGQAAQEWANISAENLDPMLFIPMCVTCHRRFDHADPKRPRR